MKNRCWTADRLARRGLPYPDACLFCDQHEETLDHIELTCVFARTIWRTLCTTIGKPAWTPEGHETLVAWCADKPKSMCVIITLVLWELWKHRNRVVFDGEAPSKSFVINRIVVECRAWKVAGLLKVDVDRFLAAMEVGHVVSS